VVGGARTSGRLDPARRPAQRRGEHAVRGLRRQTAHCAERLGIRSPGRLLVHRFGLRRPGGRRYGAIYYALPDGSKIERARGGFVFPNGIGLSPDERVLYMADTMNGRLWAFDIEAPGKLSPAPSPLRPGRVVATLPGHQICDSLAVEASGRVCVATMDMETLRSGITIIAPEGATEFIPIPGMMVTNICFGGDDMKTAWVTCGGSGQVFRLRWPLAGLVLNFAG
jgi:gluconolactonase